MLALVGYLIGPILDKVGLDAIPRRTGMLLLLLSLLVLLVLLASSWLLLLLLLLSHQLPVQAVAVRHHGRGQPRRLQRGYAPALRHDAVHGGGRVAAPPAVLVRSLAGNRGIRYIRRLEALETVALPETASYLFKQPLVRGFALYMLTRCL